MIPNEKVDLPRQPQQQKQQHQQQQQLRQQPINEPQHLTNLSYYGDDDRTASSATASSSAAAAAKDAGDAVPYNNLNFIAKLGNLAYLWSLVSKTKFIVRKPSNANNRGIGSSGASGGWIPFFNFYYHPVLPIVVFTSIMTTLLLLAIVTRKQTLPYINVAMIGNSMQYYNDLPRFLEALSAGHLKQDSCLHGNANFNTILTWGNGMYNIWNNGDSRIYNYHHGRLHDYGACTVEQLLFGYDDNLNTRVTNLIENYQDIVTAYGDDAYNISVDDAYAADVVTTDDDTDDRVFQSGDIEKSYTDDFSTYFDGSNPCLNNPFYYYYLENKYQMIQNSDARKWDYIVLNDNTRTPARNISRYESLDVLNTTYLPWILQTGAVPVFIATYGYWTPYRDMGGLSTIPEFTSLTFEGYQQYAALLEQGLPADQKPRIAPVGIAFLIVWEENYSLWQRMFHVDQIHCGPICTYLQGLILYHTLFGVMPQYNNAVRQDMSTLFFHARRFQPGDHRRDPFPTQEEAAYLYNIAVRVMIHNHIPLSFIRYKNGEAVDYDPQDDLYKADDLF